LVDEDLYFIKVLLFKRSLVHNNRCIWYKLQDNHLGKSSKVKKRGFVFDNYYFFSSQAMLESSLQWKLSSFQIRSPKPIYHIYIIYMYISHLFTYIIYMQITYIVQLSSLKIKESRDAKPNEQRSVFSPRTPRLPEKEASYHKYKY